FLQSLPWLGNVRELRNALEHAVIVSRGGPLLPEHFPTAPGIASLNPAEQLASAVVHWLTDRIKAHAGAAPNDLYQDMLGVVEPALLNEVLRRVQGNRWVAAQWLGLNRATVRKKLGMYNLTDAHRPGDAAKEPPEEDE